MSKAPSDCSNGALSSSVPAWHIAYLLVCFKKPLQNCCNFGSCCIILRIDCGFCFTLHQTASDNILHSGNCILGNAFCGCSFHSYFIVYASQSGFIASMFSQRKILSPEEIVSSFGRGTGFSPASKSKTSIFISFNLSFS